MFDELRWSTRDRRRGGCPHPPGRAKPGKGLPGTSRTRDELRSSARTRASGPTWVACLLLAWPVALVAQTPVQHFAARPFPHCRHHRQRPGGSSTFPRPGFSARRQEPPEPDFHDHRRRRPLRIPQPSGGKIFPERRQAGIHQRRLRPARAVFHCHRDRRGCGHRKPHAAAGAHGGAHRPRLRRIRRTGPRRHRHPLARRPQRGRQPHRQLSNRSVRRSGLVRIRSPRCRHLLRLRRSQAVVRSAPAIGPSSGANDVPTSGRSFAGRGLPAYVLRRSNRS